MPAPLDNQSATKHGLTAGRLPPGCGYIARETGKLRKALTDEVLDIHGEVGLCQAALIQSATRWERHALLAQRWLRREDLPVEQRLVFSREIARASTERDKCLERLGLEKSTESPYRTLDGRTLSELLDSPPAREQATGATPGAPEVKGEEGSTQ